MLHQMELTHMHPGDLRFDSDVKTALFTQHLLDYNPPTVSHISAKQPAGDSEGEQGDTEVEKKERFPMG